MKTLRYLCFFSFLLSYFTCHSASKIGRDDGSNKNKGIENNYNQDFQKQDNYYSECTTVPDSVVTFDVVLYPCIAYKSAVDVLVDAFNDFQVASTLYNVQVNYNIHLNNKCTNCSAIFKQYPKNAQLPTCDNVDDVTLLDPNTYHFFLCDKDADCEKAKVIQSATQGFVIDTRSMDAENIVNIPKSALTKKFTCPYENSSPYPYVNTEKNDKTYCSCMCHPGYVKGEDECIEKSPPSPFVLPNHCFRYNSNSGRELYGLEDYRSNFCDLQGNNLLQPPFITLDINDNYVKYYQDQQKLLPNSTVQLPKISFDLTFYAYNYKTKKFEDKSVPVPEELHSVDWTSFTKDPNPYLSKLNFKKPGNYSLSISAQDYRQKEKEIFNIIVNDFSPPYDDVTCPGYALDKTTQSYSYSYDSTLEDATTATYSYAMWFQAISNNPCGSTLECDENEPTFHTTFFGTTDKTDVTMPAQGAACLMVHDSDIVNMLNEADRLRKNPSSDPKADFCKKCCHFEKETNEKTVDIGCYGQYSEKCLSGPTCGFDACIKLNDPSNFFTASTALSTKTANATKYAAEYLNITTSPDEIHFINECETLDGNNDCKKNVTVESLISVTAAFTEDWYRTLYVGGSAIDYMSVRYSIDGSPYVSYNSSNATIYRLDRLYQPVDIEIRTPCGVLVAKKTYKLYQHPYHAINLCYTVETMGFYTRQGNGNQLFTEGLICNYPDTNFAEFSFSFDYQRADVKYFNGYAGYSDFKSIQCSAKHEGDTGNGIISGVRNVTIINETNNTVIKHFALELISKPTTAPYTPVTVSCSIKYYGFDGYVHEEICSKSFSAKDCDEPEIEMKYGNPSINPGTCGRNCTANNKLLLGSACGGNIIDFDGENTTFHSSKSDDLTCCSDCGDVKCQQQMEGVSLKTCVPYVSTAVFAEIPRRFLRSHGMLAFMTVGITISGVILAVGFVTLKAYRMHNRVRTEDGYSPLI